MWSKTSLGGLTMSRHRPNKHFGETTGVAKHAVSSTGWSERWAPAKRERRTILVVDHPLKSLPTPRSYILFFHDLGWLVQWPRNWPGTNWMCQNPRNFHSWDILHVPHTNVKLYLSQSPPMQPTSNVWISLKSAFPEAPFLWSFSKAKFDQKVQRLTPLKFNMEPENNPLEKEIPFMETILFRFHVKLQGVKVRATGR